MKKINRRNFLKVCGAVSTMGVLASCGAETDASTGTSTDSSAASGDVATSDEEVKIIVSTWDYTANETQSNVVAAFEEQNPNIKVEVMDIVGAEYTTKLSVILNGGSELDAFFLKDTDTAPSIAAKGQIENLATYVEDAGVDTAIYKGAYEGGTLEDGTVFGMPYGQQFYVLYYNKDLFDAAGVDYPTGDMTWAEFEALAGEVTSGEGADHVYGAYFQPWNGLVINWSFQSGEHNLMDTECSHFIPYYEMAVRMQEEGSLLPYADATAGGLHYSSVFYTGKAAMVPMGTWFASSIRLAVESGECPYNWDMTMIPHSEDSEAGYSVGGSSYVCMNAASKKKEATWKFIEFFTGKEAALIYSKEGALTSCSDDECLANIAAVEGMAEGVLEAFNVKNVVPDRPIVDKAAEVSAVQTDVHSLVMLGELSVEEGVAEMETVIKEVIEG